MTITLQSPIANPTFWSGYSVQPYQSKNEDDSMTMPYIVKGPKKEWGLMRNQPNPSMLFPVPEDFVNGQPKIKGVTWFKEIVNENGEEVTLVPVIS